MTPPADARPRRDDAVTELMDYAARIVFWGWHRAEGRGRLIGWPLMVLGAFWVLLTLLPVGGVCMALTVLREMDASVSGKNQR